jgi:hypothetical protein
MVGLSKEQVLACMGPPATKAAEGAAEVWSYASGNGRTDVAIPGTSRVDVLGDTEINASQLRELGRVARSLALQTQAEGSCCFRC